MCLAVSVLKPVVSNFSVSCCYFETTDETIVQLEMYIQENFAEGHVLSDCMYIIVQFLPASTFCHYGYLCKTLCPDNFLRVAHYFMAPSPSLLRAAFYIFPWGATKYSHFDRHPPSYIPPFQDVSCTHQSGWNGGTGG